MTSALMTPDQKQPWIVLLDERFTAYIHEASHDPQPPGYLEALDKLDQAIEAEIPDRRKWADWMREKCAVVEHEISTTCQSYSTMVAWREFCEVITELGEYNRPKSKCDCGGAAVNTTHSHWCSSVTGLNSEITQKVYV